MRPVVRLLFVAVLSLIAIGSAALPAAAQSTAPAQGAPASGATLLKPEELDQLVAPIALYPDALLAEVLMAATYPLEIIEGDRWVKSNASLKGDQLKAAVDAQTWDKSVKSLVATPSVLDMMSTKLDWTQKLGDAVLAQQPDVMDAIQRLRARADANGKLASTPQQKVTKTRVDNSPVIVIEPAVPDTVYVPYYDPAVVYGPWPYPAYPPYYWGAPGYIAGAVIATGIAFGAGYAIGRWAGGGYGWGGGFGWGNHNINFNRQINVNNININSGNNVWQHDPAHRHGVQYHNDAVRQKFGGNTAINAGRDNRMDFRGRDGQQVLRPDAGGAGNRPGNGPGGDRGGNLGDRGVNLGNRGGNDRPNVGNRANTSNLGNRGGGQREGGFSQINSGSMARVQSARGQASFGNRPQMSNFGGGGGGGFRGGGGGGGGGFRGGGGGGGGGFHGRR